MAAQASSTLGFHAMMIINGGKASQMQHLCQKCTKSSLSSCCCHCIASFHELSNDSKNDYQKKERISTLIAGREEGSQNCSLQEKMALKNIFLEEDLAMNYSHRT